MSVKVGLFLIQNNCIFFLFTSRQTGSLFSTLGEREEDRSVQEARKAQWKRELGAPPPSPLLFP